MLIIIESDILVSVSKFNSPCAKRTKNFTTPMSPIVKLIAQSSSLSLSPSFSYPARVSFSLSLILPSRFLWIRINNENRRGRSRVIPTSFIECNQPFNLQPRTSAAAHRVPAFENRNYVPLCSMRAGAGGSGGGEEEIDLMVIHHRGGATSRLWYRNAFAGTKWEGWQNDLTQNLNTSPRRGTAPRHGVRALPGRIPQEQRKVQQLRRQVSAAITANAHSCRSIY